MATPGYSGGAERNASVRTERMFEKSHPGIQARMAIANGSFGFAVLRHS